MVKIIVFLKNLRRIIVNWFENYITYGTPTRFTVLTNEFLHTNIIGYYNREYTGYGNPNNPEFINTLKNTFDREPIENLNSARHEVEEILKQDLPEIICRHNFIQCICVCIPRAKALNTYSKEQLYFIQAVKNATNSVPGMIDGSDVIIRHRNTCTTHLAKSTLERKLSIQNDGPMPYKGITRDTCSVQSDIIKGRKVILIDDIYTKEVNIDEDCIQTLLENGASEVIFYAVGKTGGY